MTRCVAHLIALLICTSSLSAQTPVAQFQTIYSSFAPEITLNPNSASFVWTWADLTISTGYPVALNNLASPGLQTLSVLPSRALTSLNLGFDGGDDGWTNQFSMRDKQGVTAIKFAGPL